MIEKDSSIERLAQDFANWGRKATLRIARMTRKYGVLFSSASSAFSNGEKG